MLTTTIDLIDKYDYLAEKFKKGYRFLKNTDLKTLPLGRIEIDGDEVFANVQEYITMSAADCQYEAHNNYFDIQYVVEGQEYFGCTKRSNLTAATPYDPVNDLIFFQDPPQSGAILLQPGDTAIVSPEDAHKPRCTAGSPCKVRKIVLKIKL